MNRINYNDNNLKQFYFLIKGKTIQEIFEKGYLFQKDYIRMFFITLNNSFDIADLRKILINFKGLLVQDNNKKNIYPMPLYAKKKEEVFVGRLRIDFYYKNTINLWLVSDNLLKGAATNAIQISEYLIKKNLFEIISRILLLKFSLL